MIFLLPLWPRESLKFPLFTFLLFAANLAVFLVSWPEQNHPSAIVGQDAFVQTMQRLSAVLLEPGSGVSESDRAALKENESGDAPSTDALAAIDRVHVDESVLSAGARYEWDLVYPIFAAQRASWHPGQTGADFFSRWGFRPDRPWWPRLFTHQFVQKGWAHLLVNLLFLFVAGGLAEDVVGAHLLWLYLAGGVAAALAQVEFGMPAGQVLIGASGAIAALMGFCFFARPRSRVSLFYWFLLRVGVTETPLWAFLSLWIGLEIVLGLKAAGDPTVCTAHAAHVGGFLFGAAVGLAWGSPDSSTLPKSASRMRRLSS